MTYTDLDLGIEWREKIEEYEDELEEVKLAIKHLLDKSCHKSKINITSYKIDLINTTNNQFYKFNVNKDTILSVMYENKSILEEKIEEAKLGFKKL
jgi:hypothetical protein